MATTPRSRTIDYPTSDGKPMAESETHATDLMDLVQTLQDHFAAEPDVYVWGNLLMFYEEGNSKKHISPDVFLVRGVPKEPRRDNYLIWQEGKSPDVVIELTSKSTRREDEKKKFDLYRDVLRVPEYFLFDPTKHYLKPPMKGYRLRGGVYEPIAAVGGRLPSATLGLHLERDGTELRLFNPATARRLLTRQERATEAERLAAQAERLAAQAERLAAQARGRAEAAEAENERLRRELDELRRRSSPGGE